MRALDALVPCGRGQRLGIFAGSGVGKSSLLGMIARSTSADVNVICLVGERGREVREFIERDLGPEGIARSVVVVATSDQPALVRIKAAFTATTIAEHFRDQGADVMLMMDSVTRFAMAQREVGLAIGEPPATRGYTPSVFALLPKLLERSGTSPRGSITGLYTVLVDGDDMNEPIADAVRSILDGHVVLSRDLAHAGHYPAIDVLASVSRLVGEVVSPEVRAAGDEVRRLMAAYRDKADLIAIGAYQPRHRPADRRGDRRARRRSTASCARRVDEPLDRRRGRLGADQPRAARRRAGPGRRGRRAEPPSAAPAGAAAAAGHAAPRGDPAAAPRVLAGSALAVAKCRRVGDYHATPPVPPVDSTRSTVVETPSFTFRLERVRSLRERAEERAREELAHELRLRLRGEAHAARGHRGRLGGAQTGRDAVTAPHAAAPTCIAAQAYIERAERKRREAALDLDRQDAEVAARRTALQSAARERQVIDQLKERQPRRPQRRVGPQAQGALDEVALSVHRRGGRRVSVDAVVARVERARSS